MNILIFVSLLIGGSALFHKLTNIVTIEQTIEYELVILVALFLLIDGIISHFIVEIKVMKLCEGSVFYESNLQTYIAIPISAMLMTSMGLNGIWIGFLCGIVVFGIIISMKSLIVRTDWDLIA